MKNTLEAIKARCAIMPDGCWLWTGRTHDGYGYVSWAGRNRRVHRLMYELLVGPIPDGLHIDHLCRVRSCCNPKHLQPVTNAENLRRSPLVGFNNGNAAKSSCRNGHEFTAENTYQRPSGGRTCRACNRDSAARTQRVRLDRMIDSRWES